MTQTTLAEKLHMYFENTGVKKNWFAKKIGISNLLMYQILRGTHPIPFRCWVKTIELSRGQITLADLERHKYRDHEEIKVIETKDPTVCKMKIKTKLIRS